MAFPATLDDLSLTRASSDDDELDSPNHLDHHAAEDAAVEALEAKVGVDNSAVATSLDYLLKNASSINPGHKHSSLSALDGTPAQAVYVDNDGNVGIGTTTPGAKLDVKDGNIALSDADVTQPATDFAPANAYGYFNISSATLGGLTVTGLNDGNTIPLIFKGIHGGTNPTDTLEAIRLQAMKSDGGTGGVALGATEEVLQVWNYATEIMTILGNGDVGFGRSPSQKLDVSSTLMLMGDSFWHSFNGGHITVNSSTPTTLYTIPTVTGSGVIYVCSVDTSATSVARYLGIVYWSRPGGSLGTAIEEKVGAANGAITMSGNDVQFQAANIYLDRMKVFGFYITS